MMMMNRRELLVCLGAHVYRQKKLILTTAFTNDKASFLDVTLDHREESSITKRRKKDDEEEEEEGKLYVQIGQTSYKESSISFCSFFFGEVSTVVRYIGIVVLWFPCLFLSRR